jgi:hypothetical protein
VSGAVERGRDATCANYEDDHTAVSDQLPWPADATTTKKSVKVKTPGFGFPSFWRHLESDDFPGGDLMLRSCGWSASPQARDPRDVEESAGDGEHCAIERRVM